MTGKPKMYMSTHIAQWKGQTSRTVGAAATASDRQRIRNARQAARRSLEGIDAARRAAVRVAFRQELAATVRCASPFLIALLAAEGLSVEDAVSLIEPHPGWPRRPRLGGPSAKHVTQHMLRHYVAGFSPRGRVFPPMPGDGHSHTIERAEGGWLRIEVVGHSLEVEAEIGELCFATRFGELRIELDRVLPETLADACRGRPIENVVDHAALRDRGWTIGGVEASRHPHGGQVLVVETGVVSFRMP